MRLYGPEGFTDTEEIHAILRDREPSDYFGFPNDGSLGGVVYFVGLTTDEAKRLLLLLPEEQRGDVQNNSPSFEQFVALGEKYPRMTFQGYRVLSRREDERITIDGFVIPAEDVTPEFREMVEGTEDIDGLNPNEWGELNGFMRAWWD